MAILTIDLKDEVADRVLDAIVSQFHQPHKFGFGGAGTNKIPETKEEKIEFANQHLGNYIRQITKDHEEKLARAAIEPIDL